MDLTGLLAERMKISWFQARRLDAIDAILARYGRLQRSDLMAMFGVSTPQASVDIQRFIAEYPKAIKYDATAKCYVPVGEIYKRQRKLPLIVHQTIEMLSHMEIAS